MTRQASRGPGTALAVAAGLFLASLAPACQRASAAIPTTGAEFDRATAGMSRTQTTKYVFATYKCAACHTVDERGNLGLTPRGEASLEGFIGCSRLLTAVGTVLAIPEPDRTADDRRVHDKFNEYGCAFCHTVEPGRSSFTEIGARLGFLHSGCVEMATETKKPS